MKINKNFGTLALGIFLSTSLINAQASVNDIFFKGQGINFIKTEPTADLGALSIKFSGCSVLSNQTQAVCSDIKKVHQDRFKEMRNCEAYKFAYGFAESAIGAAGTTVFGAFTYIGIVAFVPIAVGTGLATVASGAVTAHGGNSMLQADRKTEVYSENTEFDQSYISSMKYVNFVNTLKSTFEKSLINCNVAGDTAEVDSTPYTINLSDEQIRALRRSAANNN